MKKIVCILVLTCVVMGGAFAQQRAAAKAEAKNSVAMDLFPLYRGIIASNDYFTDISVSFAYERMVAPHFSVGPKTDFYYMTYDGADFNNLYFSLAVEGRYYPAANFDKFFVGTTLGFNMLSIDGRTKEKYGGFVGLITSLDMGYKVKIGKIFYVEPSLSYVLSKSSSGIVMPVKEGAGGLGALFGSLGSGGDFGAPPTPNGWQGGLRIGFTF